MIGILIYSLNGAVANISHAAPLQSRSIINTPNDVPYYVISLSPHLTDILQELDLQQYIKGVSDDDASFKKHKIYKQIPIVADAKSLFQEKILQIKTNIENNTQKKPNFKTTLIALFWQGGNPQNFQSFFEKNKIPIIYFKTKSVDDILYTAYYLIYLLHPPNHRKYYLNKIKSLQKKLINFKNSQQKFKSYQKEYFFQPIWAKPWMILNGANYSNDFLGYCGLVNAFERAPSMQISLEALLQTPFKHIIYNPKAAEEVLDLRRFQSFSVQSNKRWHPVDTNILIRPNLENLAKLPQFCRDLTD